ncbi:hypothetical protein [Flavihumibacter sp. CACIAM 22H1]|uniref:hypothetical protein n=1 Tax=Flavihumibacter sp. CACIAM 22H1 TaxID=1812911 RepID=UPI0007A830E0|nr:hypothetical protein [Flavihumibacter sp. CACIAM 22H1]KYP14144.1 MAG: hypothetical protein A1D16_20035 [Flavihumibacter sp. CACIAM 22H1]
MKKYYVNEKEQDNGDHEVHHEDCIYLPAAQNRSYLGQFSNCAEAVKEARKLYKQVNGCKTCSNQCHTQ